MFSFGSNTKTGVLNLLHRDCSPVQTVWFSTCGPILVVIQSKVSLALRPSKPLLQTTTTVVNS